MPVEPISLLGIPLDANSSFLFGCEGAPESIRRALHSASGNASTEAAVDVTPLLDDLGDVEIVNERGSRADADAISAAVRAQLAEGRQLISLGGDHSVSWPLVTAAAGKTSPSAVQSLLGGDSAAEGSDSTPAEGGE